MYRNSQPQEVATSQTFPFEPSRQNDPRLFQDRTVFVQNRTSSPLQGVREVRTSNVSPPPRTNIRVVNNPGPPIPIREYQPIPVG
jgi:hypothetical protein